MLSSELIYILKKEVVEFYDQLPIIPLCFCRILTSMSGWIKNILSTEQKKSDFRPEEHGVGLVERTTVLNCYQSCKV